MRYESWHLIHLYAYLGVSRQNLDAVLKIWIMSTAEPIQKQFNKKLSIFEVQSILAGYVLR